MSQSIYWLTKAIDFEHEGKKSSTLQFLIQQVKNLFKFLLILKKNYNLYHI